MAQNVGIESIWRPEFAFGAPVEEVDLNEGEGDMVEVEGWSPFDDNCLTLAIQTAWSADEAAEGVETKVESEGHDPRDYYVRDLIDPLALMEMMQCESIVDFKDRVRKMPA